MGYRAVILECSPVTGPEGNKHEKRKKHTVLCFLCLFFIALFDPGCRNERSSTPTDPEPGIPLTLATQRAQAIESISYDLSFTIPAAPSDPVTGHAVIRFSTQD